MGFALYLFTTSTTKMMELLGSMRFSSIPSSRVSRLVKLFPLGEQHAHKSVIMAKIFLSSLFPEDAGSWELGPFKAFCKSAETSKHELVGNPKEADLIFLADEGYAAVNDLNSTPIYKKFFDKCFAFSQRDIPIPLVPGLYASIRNGDYDRGWCRTGFYAREYPFSHRQRHICHYDQIQFRQNAKYLCSFAGSCQNARIRERLKELCHPRCCVIDVNRETNSANTSGNLDWMERLRLQFMDLLRDSKFSLCPRGVGTNSYRVFESMAMGRAPVILSDQWVAPLEVPWDDFAIRIAERDYKLIPEILIREEHRAQELGQRARRAWERYYEVGRIFDHAIEAFLEIRALGKTTKLHEHQLRWLGMLPKILRSELRATWLRSGKGKIISRMCL
jgi:hypothetical protein